MQDTSPIHVGDQTNPHGYNAVNLVILVMDTVKHEFEPTTTHTKIKALLWKLNLIQFNTVVLFRINTCVLMST